MKDTLATLTSPAISPQVQAFADEKGVSHYLIGVIDVARQAFPSCALSVSVGRDAGDETHEYIAVDVDVSEQPAEEILEGQRNWSEGVTRVCPSRHAVHFVLGWR